jgi:N-acetylglucosamine-6-sulfatase
MKALAAVLVFACILWAGTAAAQPYNIVIIKTDDQRWDTVDRLIDGRPVMPETTARLFEHPNAIRFLNAITPIPNCCPERAAFFAGGYYPHRTGVVANDAPNGGTGLFRKIEHRSLQVTLQGAGYRTGLFGKYFNDLGQERLRSAGYVPAGWTRFVGALKRGDWYNFLLLEDSAERRYACAHAACPARAECAYINDHYRDELVDFLRTHAPSRPVFAVFTPHAVHRPAVPACRHEGLFAGYEYRERAWCERNLRDKPPSARAFLNACNPFRDEAVRMQLRTLQAVDEAVPLILDAMSRARYPTVYVYVSDQGFMWGEHRGWGKAQPYEESIRVPFVMVVPGAAGREVKTLVSPTLDLGPTIRALAGLEEDRGSDGMNLLPIAQGDGGPYRRQMLIQYYGEGAFGPWAGVRAWERSAGISYDYKYVEYPAGDRELYLLHADPYEEHNVASNPVHAARLASLAAALKARRGFQIISPRAAPSGIRDALYDWPLRAWGGVPPYAWKAEGLPRGLRIVPGTDGARIQGTPTHRDHARVTITATDSSDITLSGGPQRFILKALIHVRNPATAGGVSPVSEGDSGARR